MKYIALISAILTPVYLYALLPNVTLTFELTIAFALISLLSASLVIAVTALSMGRAN